MTIDELKARKRELMARKKYELELQERGEGDNFALFMVNEELLDVNAQLRAIVPAGKRVHFGRKGRASSSLDAYAQNSGDRQQFIKWAGPMWMTLLKRPEPNSGRCCTVG